jgi:CBS-domain-containing membrane protein
VTDAAGRLVGIVRQDSLSEGAVLAEQLLERVPVVQEVEPLDEVFQRAIEQPLQWLPVVDDEAMLTGIVTPRGILAAYRRASRDAVRHLEWVTSEQVLVDVVVARDSPLAGRALREIRLPLDALVLAIRRGGTTLVPRGDTRLEAGDRLTVLVKTGSEEQVRALFADRAASRTSS